jgi:hypothetical protein
VTDLVHAFAAVSPSVRLPLRGPARRFVEAVDLAHDLDRALASATVFARALANDLASAPARATEPFRATCWAPTVAETLTI